MKTLTELILALANIKDQLNSTDIPVTIDGKKIESVEFITKPELKVEIKMEKQKCSCCRYCDLLEKQPFHRTTYCKYGNKTVNLFTGTIPCKNFKLK